ncbi:MAG: efflux RND transporter permease subunit [Deltaproteobacteria bacterium]|nr:efflux RND transporter permease subunit [Deltaproteobacteria bacterium]
MALPSLAVRRPITTLMLIVSLTVLGAVALFRLPLAFMPDIVEPQIFIRVPYPEASPDQVERMVARPVEDALGTVRGLENMWSYVDQEGCVVGLQLTWTTDMRLARVEVWERLDRIRAELPDDIGDITVAPTWNAREADSPILEGRLSSPQNLSESYDLLERKIVRPLQRIPGVAQVRLDGVQPQQVRINLRPTDLKHHGIDVRDVARVLASSNFDRAIGRISDGEHRYSIRVVATLASIEQIQALPIRGDGLRLSDVADVRYEEPPLEYGRHLDGNFAIGISVSQEANANTLEVTEALDARIKSMGEDQELQGINFLVWFSQGKEIRKTLQDLAWTGIFGAILASLILFGFLRRFGSTLVSVLCIPFSLLVTCGMVWVQGKSLNTLTLLGLIVGVGMLVDNAVVVMENIFRHAEAGENRRVASLLGANEVSVAVTAATLTSVIVFLPLVFSDPSKFNLILKELAVTVCITLLASLFISQTLILLATSWFIRRTPSPRGRLMRWLERRYVRLLDVNLRHRWLTPLVATLIFASAAYPYSKVDQNFDTGDAEMFAQIGMTFSEPLSLKRKEEIIKQVEAHLEPMREALRARSIYAFWADEFSLIRVYLKEGEANEETLAQVRRHLRENLPEIPGVKLEVSEQGYNWRPDAGKKVAFQLVGDDSETLAELAEEARARLEQIDGLADAFSSAQQGNQELHVQLDRALLSRYGIAAQMSAEVVALTYRGRRLPHYRTESGERQMWMLLDDKDVQTQEQLRDLKLRTEHGEVVPLAALASFEQKRGPQRIQRDQRLTSVWVGARYQTGTKDEYMAQVELAMSTMKFPYGYSWTFGRWQKEREEKSREFLVNLLLALLLIFGVMAGLFESILQAIALMVALPFALSGAIWSLYLFGADFDQPAAVGLLLLIGVVVNNGIVMVEHINSYRRKGLPRREAMLRGGQERLRPILMTASTTLLGLLPMVIQKPSLGGVYYYSIALVIMGGLVVSTFLTCIMLPTTISVIEDIYGWTRARLVRSGPSGPHQTHPVLKRFHS